jgi:AcrR family transcriptional regulator
MSFKRLLEFKQSLDRSCGMVPPQPSSDPKQRLISAALEVFAEQGFSAASTREICRRAEANSAAIHYHFGSKEALYREVIEAPMRQIMESIPHFSEPDLPLAEAVRRLLIGVMQPFSDDHTHELLHRMLARELFASDGEHRHMPAPEKIRPHFLAVVELLKRHLRATKSDPAIETLAFTVVSLAHTLMHGAKFVAANAPRLIDTPKARAAFTERLVQHGVDLIQAEQRRRGVAP